MSIPGLVQVRFPVLSALSAPDGTKGIMIEFVPKGEAPPPQPLRVALTLLQAKDLAVKLEAMIAQSEGPPPPRQTRQ